MERVRDLLDTSGRPVQNLKVPLFSNAPPVSIISGETLSPTPSPKHKGWTLFSDGIEATLEGLGYEKRKNHLLSF